MTLEKRKIGGTGIEVTVLGCGGAPLGAVGERISDDEAAQIVAAAHGHGIRYFDTAPYYGHGLSEKRFGRVLSGLPRNDFVLSSKIGRLLVPLEGGIRNPGMRDAEPYSIRYDYSYDAVRQSLDSSLERLGLDRDRRRRVEETAEHAGQLDRDTRHAAHAPTNACTESTRGRMHGSCCQESPASFEM